MEGCCTPLTLDVLHMTQQFTRIPKWLTNDLLVIVVGTAIIGPLSITRGKRKAALISIETIIRLG